MSLRARSAGAAATAAVLGGAVAAYGALTAPTPGVPGPSGQTPPPRILTLQAHPKPAEEGSFVSFAASAMPGGEDPDASLTYRWDLGDGSEPRSGIDLTSLDHRYMDDGRFEVHLRVEDSEGAVDQRSTELDVANVAPRIRVVERLGPAFRGEMVQFRASATDPGPTDQLSFTWDFGDGGTADGPAVEHRFQESGGHEVTVVVRDGDGGEDAASLHVVVGEGFEFTVGGDVTGYQEGRFAVAGVTPGENARSPQLVEGHCTVTLSFEPADGRSLLPTLSLQASIRDALRPREYAVGDDQMIEVWGDERRSPDVFFASLGTGRPEGGENNGSFTSLGGVLSIDYLDAERVEGTFQIRFEEQPPWDNYPTQRFANATGHFAGRIEQELGTPSFYTCRPPETFAVTERIPEPNELNVDWREPGIEVAFGEAIDPSTVSGNVQLDYWPSASSGDRAELRTVEGAWERMAEDDHRIRFVPQAPLMDGVIYCLRLESGEGGIRSLEGDVLEYTPPDFDQITEPACGSGTPWPEAVEWGFATVPELADVRAAVYQVQRNAPLVPGKPTLTRVFWSWPRKTGIHDVSLVDSIPADVTVEVGGRRVYPTKRRQTLQRSGLYTFEDTVQARNSVRLFGWKPRPGGSADVQVTVEPSGQRGSQPRRFEWSTPQPIERERFSPVLTLDYYFLRVGSWSDGVPETSRRLGHFLVEDGALFTTQNFPVVETRPRFRGELDGTVPWLADPVNQAAGDLWDAAGDTDADAIVGLIPRDLQEGLLGTMRSLTGSHFSVELGGGLRVVLMPVGVADEKSFAHEFGHFYGLCHPGDSPARPNACLEADQDHEGFRILPGGRAGRNKDEGNEEAQDLRTLDPLMRQGLLAPGEVFVTRQHYRRLLHNMQLLEELGPVSALPRPTGIRYATTLPFPALRPLPLEEMDYARTSPFSSGAPVAAGAPAPTSSAPQGDHMRVVGVLDTGGTGAEIVRVTVGPPRAARKEPLAVPGVADTPSSSGPPSPFGLRLLDADGEELAATDIVPLRWSGSHDDPDLPNDGVRFFAAEVPLEEGAARLIVERDGAVLDQRLRSGSPPRVSFREPAEGAVLRGETSLHWSANDPDGDALTYSLHYSPGGSEWRPVAIGLSEPVHLVDAAALEPGPDPRFRVTASDGFDRAQATVPVALRDELHPLATLPDGSEPVRLDAPVVATFQTPLVEEDWTAQPPLVLRPTDGEEVPADLVVEGGGRRLVLVPWSPLEAGREYVVTLSPGPGDVHGRALPDEVAWTFRTVDAPERSDPTPAAGEPDVPESDETASETGPDELAPHPDAPSPAEADALGPRGIRWVSVQANGRPDLSFHGSGVDGTAGANIVCFDRSQAVIVVWNGGSANQASATLQLQTGVPVGQGATGSFPLTNAQLQSPGLPERFIGTTGTVEVVRHDAPSDASARRFEARIRGVRLRGEGSGEEIELSVGVSVNAACGLFPP